MNCLHCSKPITREYPWSQYVHEDTEKVECADGQGEATPDVAELVVGFCRKMNELSNVGREASK